MEEKTVVYDRFTAEIATNAESPEPFFLIGVVFILSTLTSLTSIVPDSIAILRKQEC
jgi:hypothetical protein